MKITPLALKTTPLCIMPDGILICYQKGFIIVLDGKEVQKRISLSTSTKEKVLGYCKAMYRLFRMGIRSAIAINETSIAFSAGNLIRELDINTGEISKGYVCDEGVRPLTFTQIKGIKGFEDGVCFGGYVHNFEKRSVCVYHRVGTDRWKVVYTFPEGTINHVHNIIADPYRHCLWIYTGDFGDSAAIWKVTDGFSKVERFVSGEQKWRGCVAFAVPDGLLYATDAPFAKNHIYLLKEDGTLTIVGDLSGSCIYGCTWKDKYVFSTVVEPDGRNETLLRLLFGWKRGAGITDNNARIYLGDIKDGFKEIYKEKKDNYPYIFQFGAFMFPNGVNNSELLYFQPVATRKDDLRLLGISLS